MKTKYGWFLMAAVLSSAGCAKRQVERYFEVTAALETRPVKTEGDAADDVALWVHPTNPELSAMIGTDKERGLIVYGLDGNVLSEYDHGKLNNVDLRKNFVVSENRTTGSMAVYTIDPETRLLTRVDRDQPIIEGGVYGSSLYLDRDNDVLYSFAGSRSGKVTQVLHTEHPDGSVSGEIVREIIIPSGVEGIVVDDFNNAVYIGEEEAGIWKYDARPETTTEGTRIYTMDKNGPIWEADIEGLAMYFLNETEGYLVVSAQGHDRYAIFDRQSPHDYIGSISIVDGIVDGVTHTDGLEVTNLPLGEGLPYGALVVQDDSNPGAHQNFKVISWEKIVEASEGKLRWNTEFDPR